jgi:hypothetical protein
MWTNVEVGLMALEHRDGKPYIIVAPADEQPVGTPALPADAADPLVAGRDPTTGRITTRQAAAALGRLGGLASAQRDRWAKEAGFGPLLAGHAADPAFAEVPKRVKLRYDATREALANDVGGGYVGPGPSGLVWTYANCQEWSSALFEACALADPTLGTAADAPSEAIDVEEPDPRGVRIVHFRVAKMAWDDIAAEEKLTVIEVRRLYRAERARRRAEARADRLDVAEDERDGLDALERDANEVRLTHRATDKVLVRLAAVREVRELKRDRAKGEPARLGAQRQNLLNLAKALGEAAKQAYLGAHEMAVKEGKARAKANPTHVPWLVPDDDDESEEQQP